MAVYEVDAEASRRRVFSPGDRDVAEHLRLDRKRLERTLSAAGTMRDARVLELGANPYILTLALLRAGARVQVGAHPLAEAIAPELVIFEGPDNRGVASVPLNRFNVELDPFPYENESFDVVVAGEILEHLAQAPERFFSECNRVLRRGGQLIITTPNAVSFSRIAMLARGRNPDWPFSSQGLYARHNRLYTTPELVDLCLGNNFGLPEVIGTNYPHPREWYGRGPLGAVKWRVATGVYCLIASRDRRARRWADTLILRAGKESGPTFYRPGWLVGANDSLPMFGVTDAPTGRKRSQHS